MEYPKVRHPMHRESTPDDLSGQTLVTDQSQGNDTDVNRIVARFARTGIMPGDDEKAQYADVTPLQGDLTELIDKSQKAADELTEKQKTAAKSAVEKTAKDAEELKALRKTRDEQLKQQAETLNNKTET